MKTFAFQYNEKKRCPCCESSWDCCMATDSTTKRMGDCVGNLNERPEFCPLVELEGLGQRNPSE